MNFNSLEFAIFLPIVFGLYWVLKERYRWMLLLISSYYFYMSWNAKYVILIFLTTVISYVCALVLERSKNEKQRRWCIGITIVVSLGVLFVFKYFNFFASSVFGILKSMEIPIRSVALKIILPVGISFYTFQTLSYVIDVYRGVTKAEHHFGKYATFVCFFPQLVAGPIERSENLLPQIGKNHRFDYAQVTYGLRLMLWGFFKKMVIADNLGSVVDGIYNNVREFQGGVLIVSTIFFAIQIYCDFSGYSDIARGVAKMFGIELMKNFRSPYIAATLREFWRRWHVSLSEWFRDYVYIPLGGNRKGKCKQYFNLLITFTISGLWHGANWTYVIWGMIHGVVQIGEDILRKKKTVKNQLASCCITFIIVTIAWVFFRANSIGDATYIFANCFRGITSPIDYAYSALKELGLPKMKLLLYSAFAILLLVFDYFDDKYDVIKIVGGLRKGFRWCIYYVMVLIILIFAWWGEAQFVYFQF